MNEKWNEEKSLKNEFFEKREAKDMENWLFNFNNKNGDELDFLLSREEREQFFWQMKISLKLRHK